MIKKLSERLKKPSAIANDLENTTTTNEHYSSAQLLRRMRGTDDDNHDDNDDVNDDVKKMDQEEEEEEEETREKGNDRNAVIAGTKVHRKKRRENGGQLELEDVFAAGRRTKRTKELATGSTNAFDPADDKIALALRRPIVQTREMCTLKEREKQKRKILKKQRRMIEGALGGLVDVERNNADFESAFIGYRISSGLNSTGLGRGYSSFFGDKEEEEEEDKNDNDRSLLINKSSSSRSTTSSSAYPIDWSLKTKATFAKICCFSNKTGKSSDNNNRTTNRAGDHDNNNDNHNNNDNDDDLLEEEDINGFSWVNDERGASAAAAGTHDAFTNIQGVPRLSEPSSAMMSSLFGGGGYNNTYTNNTINSNSRRSAAMQCATISFCYPDARIPTQAVQKLSFSFNDSASTETNNWFRKRSDTWTEALSSAYSRLRTYFSYSFYVCYEDRRIFFACPGIVSNGNGSSSLSSSSSMTLAKKSTDFKNNNNNKNEEEEEEETEEYNRNEEDQDERRRGKNNEQQQQIGFAVITNTNSKLREILTKNGIPFKPVCVSRDGKRFSMNDILNNKDGLGGFAKGFGDANLFNVNEEDNNINNLENDDDNAEEEVEDEEKEEVVVVGGGEEEEEEGDLKLQEHPNDSQEENEDPNNNNNNNKNKNKNEKLEQREQETNNNKNQLHPEVMAAWEENKKIMKQKAEAEKNLFFERFTRDGAIIVRGTLAVHGLVNVLLQFRGQDPGGKVSEYGVMDSESLALMNNINNINSNSNKNNNNSGTAAMQYKKMPEKELISTDVGAILAPRPFANCFSKSFELRPNKVTTSSKTSDSKFMQLWTLEIGSNTTKKNAKKNSRRQRSVDPCDLIPPWTMARICRVLLDDLRAVVGGSRTTPLNNKDEEDKEEEEEGNADDEGEDGGESETDDDDDKKLSKLDILKRTVEKNKHTVRVWIETDPSSKVLNASVSALRLMNEALVSKKELALAAAAVRDKNNEGEEGGEEEEEEEEDIAMYNSRFHNNNSRDIIIADCDTKPRPEAFGDCEEKNWVFSGNNSTKKGNERRREVKKIAAGDDDDDDDDDEQQQQQQRNTGVVQSLELSLSLTKRTNRKNRKQPRERELVLKYAKSWK